MSNYFGWEIISAISIVDTALVMAFTIGFSVVIYAKWTEIRKVKKKTVPAQFRNCA